MIEVTKAWVARDKDGSVFMYKNKPTKGEAGWETNDIFYQNITWWKNEFNDLMWKDEEPRQIEIRMIPQRVRVIQRIEVGKHIQDLFNLECVTSVDKGLDGKIRVMVKEYDGVYSIAREGDYISLREDGLWMIEKGGSNGK